MGARQLGDQIDYGLLRKWISFCGRNHKTCIRRAKARKQFSIKLIDCVDRRIVWRKKEQQFVRLSYRWGQQERRRFTEGPLDGPLPPLIEDVIEVTLKLGYRYLWIDLYCIDQDNAEEKAIQIAQMDVIYRASELTIIAATISGVHERLPGVRPNSRPCSRLLSYQIGRMQ